MKRKTPVTPFLLIIISVIATPYTLPSFDSPAPSVATQSSLVWRVQNVEYVESPWYTSLALDHDGMPHICYSSGGAIKYVRLTEDGWSREYIQYSFCHAPSMALDRNGSPHIVYLDGMYTNTVYTTWNGTGWTYDAVDLLNGWPPSIELDTAGNPHVCYAIFEGVLKYAVKRGGVWRVEAIETLPEIGRYVSLALDSRERPHIGYYDKENGDLKYAWWNGTSWVKMNVDTAGDVGLFVSLALDSNDIPHMSYYDATNKELRYARWNGSGWVRESVDTDGDVGLYTSLALDSRGNPHISYYDKGNGDLKYAWWNGSGWETVRVDTAGDTGLSTSLQLDSHGCAHISYVSATAKRLRYARTITLPTEPQNLSVRVGDGFVLLNWTPPFYNGGERICNYTIYRSELEGEERVLTIVDGNTLTYNDTEVENGVEYRYCVSAVNRAGEGPRSEEVSVLAGGLPGEPGWIEVRGGDGYVFLEWGEVEYDGGLPVESYRVYRREGGGEVELLVEVEGERRYNDTDVENGVEYSYSVSAVNGIGEGPRSEEVSVTPLAAPSSPRELKAFESGEGVLLLWSPPEYNGGAPVVGYRVYRSLQGGDFMLYSEVVGELRFTDSDVIRGIEYSYMVSAVNIVGEGVPAGPVTIRLPTPPAPPRNATVQILSDSLCLRWEEPEDDGGADVIGYTIYRTVDGGPLELLASLGLKREYIDGDVQPGVRYLYRISATNRVGEGPPSDPVRALFAYPPSRPENLRGKVMKGAPLHPFYVSLSWEKPEADGGSPVEFYRVYRMEEGEGEHLLTEVHGATHLIDYNVTVGGIYHYRVSAVNIAGEGEISPAVVVLVGEVPGPPRYLITIPGSDKIVLEWYPPEYDGGFPVVEYCIYRAAERGPAELIGTVEGDVRIFEDMEVSPGTLYHYWVSAVNAVGEGNMSVERTAMIRQGAEGVGAAHMPWQWILVTALLAISLVPIGLFLYRRFMGGGLGGNTGEGERDVHSHQDEYGKLQK